MHQIEPFYAWQKYYQTYEDKLGPFFGRESEEQYTNAIYDYYIHPYWDHIGSETLYCKILMVNYTFGYAVIELLGEWNDTLHNDSMYLKRYVIDILLKRNIQKYILIGENIFQFHGGDTDYYDEWLEDCESGWIVTLGFRDFIVSEWRKYHLDAYFNYGGPLEISNWRTLKPDALFLKINEIVEKRLGN
jgi:hypothetical protein